jgi:hypothetical protein
LGLSLFPLFSSNRGTVVPVIKHLGKDVNTCVPMIHLAQAFLNLSHLAQAFLTLIHLAQAFLTLIHLAQAFLTFIHLA